MNKTQNPIIKRFPSIYKQPLLQLAVSITDVIRPFVLAEKPQITGLKNIPDTDTPTLWLPQHQSWDDILTLGEAWYLVNSPRLKAIAKSDYIHKVPPLSAVLRTVMNYSGLFHIIYREDERKKHGERKKLKNREVTDSVIEELSQGIHDVTLPEGTSRNNGRIFPLKPGCYFIAKTGVPCIAVGNTYDFISGTDGFLRRKNLAFFNFSKVFKHEPLEKLPDESKAEYIRRDKANFLGTIRNYFLDHNTITTAQLGSLYLIQVSKQPNKNISFEKLRESVLIHVDRLKTFEGIIIDQALLDETKREQRLHNFYQRAIQQGFIFLVAGKPYIDSTRTLKEPESKDYYRKENPVLHAANKLIEVAEERPRIAERLDYFPSYHKG